MRIGGAIVGATGAAFGFTFPSEVPPASTMEAVDYVSTPISWNLVVDPPPTPQAMLHLGITNQASSLFTITSVAWTVVRQELNGTLTPIASPTGQSTALLLPSNGQYQIHAAVSVDDLVNGVNVLAEFRGNTTVQGISQQVIVWSNVDLTLTGFAHEYKRHGTTTLFAALEVATGLVHSGHYRRRRGVSFWIS